jgi:farnesyl-diphosphate farnesyltransferase
MLPVLRRFLAMSDFDRRLLGREILKRVSRSFYLSLVLLPKPMREPLSLGYLLARASDTIADAGSLSPTLRAELLEKFRGAVVASDVSAVEEVQSQLRSSGGLTDAGERELVERLPECLQWLTSIENEEMRAAIDGVLRVISSGQAWDIERFEKGDGEMQFCANANELRDYTFRVAGCVGEFWTRVGFLSGVNFADREIGDDLMASGGRYGQGLQLVNILRDLGEDLKNGRCYLPREDLVEAGWREGNWEKNRKALMTVADRWRAVAREWLEEGEQYAGQLRSRRVSLATLLPARLGLRTLDLLDEAGAEVLERRVKISRGTVWREVVKGLLF